MQSSDAPVFDFQERCQVLATLPTDEQIRALKGELREALRQTAALHDRNGALERDVDRLGAQAVARTREHQAFAARLHRQLTQAACDRATATVDGQMELRAVRRELDTMTERCCALAERCRWLLLTIEQAACAQAAAEDAISTDVAQASA